VRYPIENGMVYNWDDMEALWRHAYYNELRIDPKDHAFMLSESHIVGT